MKYGLVRYFRTVKTGRETTGYAVIPNECLSPEERNWKIGNIIHVPFGNKLYTAEVMRLSEDKMHLDILRLSQASDEIAVSQVVVDASTKKVKNDAADKTRPVRSRERRDKNTSNAVDLHLDKFASTVPHVIVPSDMATPRRFRVGSTDCDSKKTSCSANAPNTTESSRDKTHDDKAAGNLPQEENSKHESHQVKGAMIMMEVTPEESRFITTILRNPHTPVVSSANLSAIKNLTTFYESLCQVQMAAIVRKETEQVISTPPQKTSLLINYDWIKQHTCSAVGKEKLYEGYEVYINSVDKKFLSTTYGHNRMDLARRLLKNLVGPDNLAGMSARGNGMYAAIPSAILSAVQDYILNLSVCKSDSKFTPAYFTSKVNEMCTNLRSHKGLCAKVSLPATTVKGELRRKPGRKRKLQTSPEVQENPDGPAQAELLQTEGVVSSVLMEPSSADPLLIPMKTENPTEPSLLQREKDVMDSASIGQQKHAANAEEDSDFHHNDDDSGESRPPSNLPTITDVSEADHFIFTDLTNSTYQSHCTSSGILDSFKQEYVD